MAVIRIDAKEPLPFLQFGDSDAMEVGDRVLAVGSPFGLTRLGDPGDRQRQESQPEPESARGLPSDRCGGEPGSSGGPLVNMEKIIGLTSAIKTRAAAAFRVWAWRSPARSPVRSRNNW